MNDEQMKAAVETDDEMDAAIRTAQSAQQFHASLIADGQGLNLGQAAEDLIARGLLAATALLSRYEAVVGAARGWRAWDVKTKKDGELLEERLAETVDALDAQGGGR